MKRLALLGLRVTAFVGGLFVLTGCPNPNTYGTPRTTPKGKVQHSVAVEGYGVRYKEPETRGGSSAGAAVPTFPTYTVRIGLSDRLDIGARVANLSSLGADLKWNFVKSEMLDLALDPGFQLFHVGGGDSDSGFTQFYGNLPLMLGFNASESVSIVPTLGISYGTNSAERVSDEDTAATFQEGMSLRGGLGFNFRISPKFAMHPEFTVLKNLPDANEYDTLLYVFGLGFNFGKLPEYGMPGEEE